MSVDTQAKTRATVPGRLTLRMAALLLGHGGVLRDREALDYAESVRTGTSGRRQPWEMVVDAMRPLVDDKVVVRVEHDWYAPRLADLAAWVADGFEAREDEGMAVDPVVPAPRRPRAAA